MAARSQSDSARRTGVPRWAYLAWIWSALPISLALYSECEGASFAPACHQFANSNLSLPWGLPAELAALAPRGAPFIVAALVPLAFSLAATVAALRLIPRRTSPWAFLAFLAGWTALGMLAFVVAVFAPHYSLGPWRG